MATVNAGRATGASLFSHELVGEIIAHTKPMGHCEDAASLNLGFGFLYYGLIRTLRPKHVLVIGSGYGFSVTCLALGLRDNGLGSLTFVDPSYSVLRDGPAKTMGGGNFWRDRDHVRQHFGRFGLDEIVTHYKQTAEAFFAEYEARRLPEIDVAFVDGNHSYKHVEHDVVATLRHSHRNTYLLLHDTNIYIREAIRHAGVKRWLRRRLAPLKSAFEFVDFPFSSGVAVVRVIEPTVWKQLTKPRT